MNLFLSLLLLMPLSSPDCGVDPIRLGQDTVYAWSDGLDGTACRQCELSPTGRAGRVRVEIDVRGGGYDAGVARSTMPIRVDKTFNAAPLVAKLDVDLTGDGHWWAGPKFCICKTNQWVGLEGNWECYIIESSDMPYQKLMGMMKATYRGRQVVDGDVYLHYTKPWNSWQQAIAVREQYRDEGEMDFGPIVRYWRENLDVPNWYMHSPKVGLETTGPIKGSFEWTKIQTSDLRQNRPPRRRTPSRTPETD